MTTPQPDRADLDQIFRVLLPRAREALTRQDGRLYPLGATLDKEGRLHAEMSVERTESAQPAVLLERMVDDFRRQAADQRIRACGIAYDAQVEGPAGTADAIATWLEHESGESAIIYLPYLRGTDGEFQFGSLIPAGGPRRIWRQDAAERHP